jgi:hypothetical protein
MTTKSHLPFWRRVDRFMERYESGNWDIFDFIWVFTGRY